MATIMIDCPSTGRAVSTGIETLSIEPLPTVIAMTQCPVCGRVHKWTKNDAWLAEGGEQYGGAGNRKPSPAQPERA
jgi:hypothetical protein